MINPDVRAFEIESLAQDHEALVVSAVRSYGNLGPFRPNNWEAFKGVRVFDILLRQSQIICGSTVVKGDTASNLYGNWGVIVGGGTIHQAFPYDATTTVVGGKIESKFLPRMQNVKPREQIEQALHGRHIYNEINVATDRIAGMFYSLDDGQRAKEAGFPSEAIQEIIKPLGLPHYLLRKGEFYPIGSMQELEDPKSDPISPLEVVHRSIVPTEEDRDYMINHLVETLSLAPRNPITSGVVRGRFAYDYRSRGNEATIQDFLDEQAVLLNDDNPSLRLYGGMALHAFAESAAESQDEVGHKAAYELAISTLSEEEFRRYSERILENGNLAITDEDLRHYLATTTLPEYLQDH